MMLMRLTAGHTNNPALGWLCKAASYCRYSAHYQFATDIAAAY